MSKRRNVRHGHTHSHEYDSQVTPYSQIEEESDTESDVGMTPPNPKKSDAEDQERIHKALNAQIQNGDNLIKNSSTIDPEILMIDRYRDMFKKYTNSLGNEKTM